MKTLKHLRLTVMLVGVLGGYAYLFLTDGFSLFVHPRLHIFSYIMVSCIIMLIIYMAGMIGEKRFITHYSQAGVGSILFLMIALYPALGAQIDPSILPIADLTLPKSENVDAEVGGGEISEANSDMGKYVDTAFVIKLVQRDHEGNITLTKESYYDTVIELVSKTERYLGEPIKASGVVYKGPEYTDDEFGVGLYYMTCCAADAQLVGMKYRTSSVPPRVGQRVSVEGVLEQDSQGKALISTDDIIPISPMEDPYMYY